MNPALLEFYFSPDGRVSRRQFWWRLVLPYVGCLMIATFAGPPNVEWAWFALYAVTAVFIVPAAYVGLKRFHDMGLSAWCLLVGLVPYVGTYILLLWLGLAPDGVGDNMYGPSPKRHGLLGRLGFQCALPEREFTQ